MFYIVGSSERGKIHDLKFVFKLVNGCRRQISRLMKRSTRYDPFLYLALLIAYANLPAGYLRTLMHRQQLELVLSKQ